MDGWASSVGAGRFLFDTLVDLLRFPLLPGRDRLRVGLATLVQVWRRDAVNLNRTPAAATETRRWYGPRAYDVLWSPLLEAKFGARHHGQIPMAWLVAGFGSAPERDMR